jgi:hypothetical protein
MDPTESLDFIREKMVPVFPLGEFKVHDALKRRK